MPALRISKFPDAVLKKASKSVISVTDRERDLLDSMIETMYLNQGIGLAAPQVGVLKKIIVIDIGTGPLRLINPVVVKKIGAEKGEEGCLSLPGAIVNIKRAEKILYRYLDAYGRCFEKEAEGLLARAIQHEIDHLNGKLIIDYANPIKKLFLKRKLLKGAD